MRGGRKGREGEEEVMGGGDFQARGRKEGSEEEERKEKEEKRRPGRGR